jgi:hypothetical protein
MDDWKSWDGLRKYNMVLFIVHLILAVVFYIYFRRIKSSSTKPSQINLSFYDHVFNYDKDAETYEVKSEETKKWTEDTISSLVVAFFGVTAAFHLFYALNPGNLYLNAVKNGNNYFRWLEYSISATIMILIIAVLSGVKDTQNYFLLLTSAFGMIWTGQWFETSKGASRWVPIIVGFILLAGPLIVIWNSFKRRLDEAKAAGFNLPSWLWATVIILFIFYTSFGVVPMVQAFKGGNYRNYEKTYLTLSLASKATLGILVGYGFGQRSQSENAN